MNDLLIDSLQRRMRTMHSLYDQAVGSMGLEHVNHFERAGVLPIAFSLFHYTNMEDVCFMVLTGDPFYVDQGGDRQLRICYTSQPASRATQIAKTLARSLAAAAREGSGPPAAVRMV